MSSIKQRCEDWLKTKSEIVYVFPAFPCILNFILVMVTVGIYLTKRDQYDKCEEQSDKSDNTHHYLSGQILCTFVFLIFYSNILLEYIKPIKGIFLHFVCLLIYFIGTLIWNIIGLTLMGDCTDTAFQSIAMVNIVLFFVFLGVCLIYSLFILIWRRKGQTQIKAQ